MSLPHAPSLCHRCLGCQVVISGRGSIFLRCLRRAEKYLAQPVMRCPAYAALPRYDAVTPRGVAEIAWLAAQPPPVEAIAVGAGGFDAAGVAPPAEASAAGAALWWREGGLRYGHEAGRGAVLGWIVAGADALVGLAAGDRVRFRAG